MPDTPRPETQEERMPLVSILSVPMQCPRCAWRGRVYDCEPDVDGDGSLGCQRCNAVMEESHDA